MAVIIALLAVNIIVTAACGVMVWKMAGRFRDIDKDTAETRAWAVEFNQAYVKSVEDLLNHVDAMGRGVEGYLKAMMESQRDAATASDKLLVTRLDTLQHNVKTDMDHVTSLVSSDVNRLIGQVLKNSEGTDRLLEARLQSLETLVKERLEAIRKTVDDELSEHLDRKLTESFSAVTQQLEAVYKGLGEMQTLAQGVGDLKKVLTNVKTRGILGETQLRSIIQDILAPEQYEENVATVPGSSERVEFAVKLPVEDGGFVYLPIDSKFPGDTYIALQNAYEAGDKAAIDACAKNLVVRLRAEAKDIKEKYLRVPDTTEFGIMFLPFEGLYAEAVNRGMVEQLSREFRVNICGPSTMAAMLCSLQMSFRTIAIQKRSSEVWEVLSAFKTEFERFDDVLGQAETRVRQAGSEIEKLRGTRMRAIARRLKGVTALPESRAQQVLGVGSGDIED